MTTLNDLTPVVPDTDASRKMRLAKPALLAAAAIGVLAVGAGGWVAFLSPHDSTVQLTADATAAAPGKPVALSGTVTPAAANRVVRLAVATNAGGPFTPAGTAVTDASGRFQTSWSPNQAGRAWVQASAAELGRDQAAQSTPTPVTVRTPATVTITLSSSTIRTTTAATVTVTVTPAGADVTLEKSPDGQSWTPVPTSDGNDGRVTAKLTSLAGGTWHLRAAAAQTDTATAASSKDATMLVEDYKAAGAKYLAIVGKGNAQVEKLNNLLDAQASLSSVKKQSERLSAALTQEAKDFRAYKEWPRAVAPVIEELARTSVVDADHYHMMSQVRSVEEWNQQADQAAGSGDKGGDAAARARDLLGLPKRNLHP